MNENLRNNIKKFLGEFLATAFLVFLGCMGCIRSPVYAFNLLQMILYPNNYLQSCLNFGLVLMTMFQCFQCVSGAHMNPAISLAAAIYELITPEIAVMYMVAQILGGVLGYGLLVAVVPRHFFANQGGARGLCITAPISEISLIQAVAIEFILTSILIWVCCSVWDPRNTNLRDSLPIKLGLVVASLSLTGVSLTGASMNPARSFGPALWNNDFRDHWIYWVGPMAAGALASIVYKELLNSQVDAA